MNSIAQSNPSAAVRRQRGIVFFSLLVLLLLLACGLRFYHLGAQSFWNDEGNSARLSERSLPLILEGTASDVHPPLYYMLLRGWRELLGDSEFGLRSFSAFAGILSVAASVALASTILSGRRYSSKNWLVPLIAALLCALNPALVYYSQEARMYSLLVLLAVLSTLVLMRWLDAQDRRALAVGYVLLTAAGLYTHYSYPIMFVLQGLIVFLWFLRRQVTLIFDPLELTAEPNWARIPLNWLMLVAMSLLLYAPWAPIFLRQTSGRAAESVSIPMYGWDSLRWMLLGATVAPGDMLLPVLAAIVLFTLAVFGGRRLVIIPALGALLPPMAMLAVGSTSPAFYKFLIVAVPFAMIWLAFAFLGPKRTTPAGDRLWTGVGGILLALLLVGMVYSLNNLYHDPTYARADYRGMATAAKNPPHAAVILDAPNQWEVFTYYFGDQLSVYPLPKGQPDPAILEPQLEDIAGSYQRIYALYWGDEQQDPRRVVEKWLNINTFKAAEEWVGDVRFATYAAPVSGGEEIPHVAAMVTFGGEITLQDYAVDVSLISPGDIARVTLNWKAEKVPQGAYKVFLHLVDQNGQIVAQRDSEPISGVSPTTSWQPGETILDRHGVLLPQALPAGEYSLVVGLYNPSNAGERLTIETADEKQNVFELGTIQVK